jgi:hypothetical protein
MTAPTGRTVTFTPTIRWYNSDDSLLSTSTGTAVALNNTWQVLQVNAAKPGAAAYGIPAIQTTNSFAIGTIVAYVSDVYFGQQGGYASFDGDTPDSATYAYTWTGQRWASPTQLNNAANIDSLASWWLSRNATKANTAYSVDFNMSQDLTAFHALMRAWGADNAANKIAIWVNGAKKNYHIMGYQVDCNLETTTVKLKTLEY